MLKKKVYRLFSCNNALNVWDCLLFILCLDQIIITLLHDEVHFLYVIAEFKQFIPLALILVVNLMNEKWKKK